MSMVAGFRLIETLPDLEALGKQLAGEQVLAVDIEADSFHHYFPKVCLVQISTNKQTFIIDPLATGNLGALQPLFSTHKIKKVFHGADYDIRSLFRDFSIKVNNLFDTMIASQFLGEKDVGLAATVKRRFGILLNKKYQKANWSKRPLGRNMLLYAAHDTAYLIGLYWELERELTSKGRLSWVEEEYEILSAECAHGAKTESVFQSAKGQDPSDDLNHRVSSGTQPETTHLFKRFKGARKMAPRDLAILENLLQFRESAAMQEDRPPFRLFRNHLINDLVAAKPTDLAALSEPPRLPADFMKRYAKRALKAIRSGLELPEDRLPSFPKAKRLPRDPKKEARIKRLKAWRELKARQLEMEPGLMCNNVLLGVLAEANPKAPNDLEAIPKMKKWQRAAFGKELIDVLCKVV
jgi:ribonuclease D